MTDENLKEWTIMVYMAGDNNLSADMARSLTDFESVSESSINLLTFFDGSSLTIPTHYIDYSDGEAERQAIEEADLVHKNAGARDTVQGGENSASAYSILNFVHWCLKTRNRKAKNYALIFSAHSFGFHGTSFLRDESSNSSMTLPLFRWTLEQVKEKYLRNEKIAILGFDSCVMSMVEVGCEVKDVAHTIVASEGNIPDAGWGYATMLKRFMVSPRNQNKNWLTTKDYVKDAAKGMVEEFIENQQKLSIGGGSVDIAAWDLDEIERLVEQVSELATELFGNLNLAKMLKEEKLTETQIVIYEQLKRCLLQSHIDCQTYMHEQCVDIKDFCQRLILECVGLEAQKIFADTEVSTFTNIKEKCRSLIAAVDKCVLKSGFCSDAYQFSNGISLYFPWTAVTYRLTNSRYSRLKFVKESGKTWDDFLVLYLFVVTRRLARKEPLSFPDLIETIAETGYPTKDNSPSGRDNSPFGRDNSPSGRDNSPSGRGDLTGYLINFSRFKNFQSNWELFGFADEYKFDEESETFALLNR